jgi:hypothetical protein
MELVEGQTLAERIARGPVPVDEALHIAKQIADHPTASPCSLRRARRWPVAGSRALDIFTIQFLPAREGAEPRVSRQVLRWSATRFPRQTTRLLRRVFAVGESKRPKRDIAELAVKFK